MAEEWLDIPGYEGRYQVSNTGLVRSRKKGGKFRLLSQQTDRDGYLRIALSRDSVSRGMFVHRLVMLAFVGECPPGYEVNHKDCNRADNHVGNLEYVTHQRNAYLRNLLRCGVGGLIEYVPDQGERERA